MLSLETFLVESSLNEAINKNVATSNLAKRLPFERYCLNRLISDGIDKGPRRVDVKLIFKKSKKFEDCIDVNYSDSVSGVRSSTTLYREPSMINVWKVLKEDPTDKNRLVYVGRDADRIARYISACCDYKAMEYVIEHPGKYSMRSTKKNYCTTIVRREVQEAFDAIYNPQDLGKGIIHQLA